MTEKSKFVRLLLFFVFLFPCLFVCLLVCLFMGFLFCNIITKNSVFWALTRQITYIKRLVNTTLHFRRRSLEETSSTSSVFLPFDKLMDKVKTFVREKGIMVRLTIFKTTS